MNPIYKTGWGQYVDLFKITMIEEWKSSSEMSKILFEGGAYLELPGYDPFSKSRKVEIDTLVTAWENYRIQ